MTNIFRVSRQTQQTVKYYQKWPRKVESNICYKWSIIYLPYITSLRLQHNNRLVQLVCMLHIIYISIMLSEEVNWSSTLLTKVIVRIAPHSLGYIKG